MTCGALLRRGARVASAVCAGMLALAVPMLSSCTDDTRQPIALHADRVVVTNLTAVKWTNVEVWVNDHYRAQASELAPEQRLDVPLASLVAGFGQRFDTRRQQPFGVEVTATGSDGRPVKVTWGSGRRR